MYRIKMGSLSSSFFFLYHNLLSNLLAQANHIFATGHSWGGDMTNVTAYFLKDPFKAIVPIASNRPYGFENNGTYIN